MYPELISLDLPVLGELTITSFGLMMVLAFLLASQTMRVRLRELGRDPDLAGDVMVAALVGGLVGAKLYYLGLNHEETLADPGGMLFSRAGLVWYGGLAGGALAVIALLLRRRVEIPFGADLTAPALALGYGIGRIGCFLVGDDYGRPTESWLGIAFPNGAPPTYAGELRRHFGVELPVATADGQLLAVYPTQLFEAAAALLIFWLLWRLRDHVHRAGWLFGAWMAAAGVERLFIEFFRVKDDRFLGPFTLAQALSGLLLLGGIYVMWRRRRPGSRPERERPGRGARVAGTEVGADA